MVIYVPIVSTEPISGGDPNVRSNLTTAEPLSGGNSNVRSNLTTAEPLSGGNSVVRMSLIVIEALMKVEEDPIVITDELPTGSAIKAPLSQAGLRGIEWSTFKRPTFRTTINEAVSGRETRNARMQYPLYQFELSYSFLDERNGNTDLSTMMGFFMQVKGQFGEWLYQDPSDYIAEGVESGIGDAGTVAFYGKKQMGSYTEPVGYFDLSNLFLFTNAAVDTLNDQVTVTGHNLQTGFGPVRLTTPGTIPPGLSATVNYWLIVVNDNTLKFATSKANALLGTAVDITGAGSGTFTASNGIAVYINGTEVPIGSAYSVVLNNTIVFLTAPALGEVVTMDFKFYYICRFLEDTQDYEQFMYNLWTLESMTFISVIK